MKHDFYINGIGSGEFSTILLTGYKVGGTGISRTHLKPSGTVQGWLPLATEYSLREIKLPVYIFGASARDAAENRSRLEAAFLAEPVELQLPNGLYYTASLQSIGDAEEMQLNGQELTCTYTFLGYAHDPLVAFTVNSDGSFDVTGTAPEMACRLTCTVGAAAASYLMAGVTWTDVSVGDVLVLDGIEKRVLCNGINAFGKTDLITWPTLHPKNNVLTAPDTIAIEYYPIWL